MQQKWGIREGADGSLSLKGKRRRRDARGRSCRAAVTIIIQIRTTAAISIVQPDVVRYTRRDMRQRSIAWKNTAQAVYRRRIAMGAGEERTVDRINSVVQKQFAIDYHCYELDFENTDTLITAARPHPKARKFACDSILSMLSYRGKLVITASDALLPWCNDVLKPHTSAQWGFEAQTLCSIDKKLSEFGHGIDQAHLYFLPVSFAEEPAGNITWLYGKEIAALEEDERIDEAFLFEDYVEDVLGAALLSDQNELLAVAGATANSDTMWELGCNALIPGKGYGTTVLSALAKEVYARGKIPYTGTALSHIASQCVSHKAGFRPAFCELRSCPL